jgi:hypothetical protein
MIEPFLEAIADFVGEALLEGIAYLFSNAVLKGFQLVQDLWAMLMGR